MDKEKNILEYAGNNKALLTLNRLLQGIGFTSSLPADFILSEADVVRLNYILGLEVAKDYYDAWLNLRKTENILRQLAGLGHYNYATANIKSMTNLEKQYYYDLLSNKYKDRLFRFNLLNSLEYSDDNLKILIDIHLLKSCWYNVEGGNYLCSYDDSNDVLVDDESDTCYVYNLDYDSLHIIAKKFVFADIIESNRDVIVTNCIIADLNYSEDNFRKLFKVKKHYIDLGYYI